MAQINKSSEYFNTVTWTGTGSTQSVTGVGFEPDWVWLKSRNAATDHGLFDSVRGVQKLLISNGTDAESTTSGLTSFDSDGFTLGSANSNFNFSGRTMVGWNWLASNTTASNNDGSITSTVSANTTSGFSIVSYTGTGANATVGHGLSSAPKFIMFKNRTVARNWIAYHDSIGATKFMYPNLTNAETTDSTAFNNTAPTSSVFSLGSNVGGNESGSSIIAYCFAEKKGFSKFGTYTGNGSADGTFIYTGFKPAFILTKLSSAAGEDWFIWDNKRLGYNVDNNFIKANSSITEQTDDFVDITSNGFKLRTSNVGVNYNTGTYIYMAIAENPLVSTAGVPCTAR